jgi:beta-lactamase class A
VRRREFLRRSGGALYGLTIGDALQRSAEARGRAEPSLASIEQRVGGRLGVAALDVATGDRIEHRAHERFPMCSTFKWLLAAQILSRADNGGESLDRVVPYTAADLQEYAPIARQHVSDGGMTVAALAAAAVQYSDNTAANLLLATVGGPSALTSFARRLGDSVTRLDRTEPELNTSVPGDPRDTTTPSAMVADLRKVLLGSVLTPASRDRLNSWLQGNTTGNERLRAGFTDAWRVGDKTGTGPHGSTNDVAIAWTETGSPILVAAYLTDTDASITDRNAALARVGALVRQRVVASRH